MTALDDITRSLKDLYQRLAVSGKKTAAITRLRMELAGLDRQRKELFGTIGERVSELRRAGQIRDVGLIGLLEHEFDSLDRLRKRIQDTMDSIQQLNLQEIELGDLPVSAEDDEMRAESENLLNSFEVL